MSAASEESGVSRLEYALLAALVAILLVAGLTLVGGALDDWYRERDRSSPSADPSEAK